MKYTNQTALTVTESNNEIDLRELLMVLWHGRWVITVVTVVFAVSSVFYALSLPDIYKSEALLASVTEDSGLKIPGQLGGLAALAGVNMGGGSDGKTSLALEIIKSREFLGGFIKKHDLFVSIMAAKGWDRSDNVLQIDEDLYNITTNQWAREVKAPFKPEPSVLETYEVFLELLSVSQDKETGMIKLSIQHYSPYLAKQWVTLLVEDINNEMRRRDLAEAENSISYLNTQLEKTNVADVRAMLYSLIEEQTKTLMLANVRKEYVFKTVDPAVVAEKKLNPPERLFAF